MTIRRPAAVASPPPPPPPNVPVSDADAKRGTVLVTTTRETLPLPAAPCPAVDDCAICKDSLVNPVSAPCGHNYCQACLYELLRRTRLRDQPKCPKCRALLKRELPAINIELRS